MKNHFLSLINIILKWCQIGSGGDGFIFQEGCTVLTCAKLADNIVVFASSVDMGISMMEDLVLPDMILLTLRQRTLHFETYVMPEPEENQEEFYRHFLMRNNKLRNLSFSIGQENAVYLSGELQNQWISEDTLDRIIGSIYETVELTFKPALRIGFASRFFG